MTRKSARLRLAKAELWMAIACSHLVADLGTPSLDPRDPSPAEDLADKYNLTLADMARLGEAIGAELEARAIRAGYEDHWDDDPERNLTR